MQTPKGEINDKIMELLQDEAILAKMAAAGSGKECYDLVKDRIGISFEEFQASMKVAKAFVNESADGELSEDDLDTVAGGKGSSSGKITIDKPYIRPYNDPKIISPVIFAALK